ncbi:hypothetical protein FD04_GL000414 [Secundilactobacillus odoratitofui DSM 19909 = JCM 15043]|uniref:Uncharacterized protein n=1 Tax=Secundilactobacillus odoratitofui DSM 19909 = JCM 15043 TaxID=1423776 RepID=A0A0R1M4A2_9LACO|nr:hypothetical protein [Secundilactobacillus odoratitofui]KRK98679.1 hypothetical protein FD04_GL000414 [Secundilactobacillus odoratitofui DSM 19909 = JCM 15043]
MDKLQLTDKQAHTLIHCLKNVLDTHSKTLSNGDRGKFTLESTRVENVPQYFQVDYMYDVDDIHINLMDLKTHHTLIRINLDTKFHNNSDGKVRGHRVEVFSVAEFEAKHDSFTHIKAYPFPYDGLNDTNDFLEAMQELLDYTNVHKQNRINIVIASDLDI